MRKNLIDDANFWVLEPNPGGSWIWKAICKLRDLARPFLHCQVGSRITSFWFDNWTSVVPLIELVGTRGPVSTGIDINAVVADALSNDGWCFEHSRSRNPIITLLKNYVPDSQPILRSEVDDT